MRRKVAAVLMIAVGLGPATATAATSPAPYRSDTVSVRCNERLTEDTAANVHLTVYERLADGRLKLKYHCDADGF